MKAPLTKKVSLDGRHSVEIVLSGNGQIYFTMKTLGLVSNNGDWNSDDWFQSQISFPPAMVTEMARVLKQWLLCYVENSIIGQLLKLGVQFTSVLDLKKEFLKSSILYEGAQGILLDLNHGSYPFVSCGDCTVAGIYASGFAFAPPQKVYGVAKAYQTKVGEGPFPTELHGADAEELRKIGNEYGATTGRPRRVGWLDLPALRYAIDKGGITHLVITKLDILNGLDGFAVCDQYGQDNIDPVCGQDFFETQPEYRRIPGWKDAGKLDDKVMNFVNFVEQQTKIVVEYVSTGTSVDDIHRLN